MKDTYPLSSTILMLLFTKLKIILPIFNDNQVIKFQSFECMIRVTYSRLFTNIYLYQINTTLKLVTSIAHHPKMQTHNSGHLAISIDIKKINRYQQQISGMIVIVSTAEPLSRAMRSVCGCRSLILTRGNLKTFIMRSRRKMQPIFRTMSPGPTTNLLSKQ